MRYRATATEDAGLPLALEVVARVRILPVNQGMWKLRPVALSSPPRRLRPERFNRRRNRT
jgi:hypothetical protein